MVTAEIQAMLEQVEQLLREGQLSERIEQAIKKLLNAIEALTADKKSLADEVDRLKAQLEQKKKAKTTANRPGDDHNQIPPADHSTEKRRRKRERKKRRKAIDRRSFKDVTIRRPQCRHTLRRRIRPSRSGSVCVVSKCRQPHWGQQIPSSERGGLGCFIRGASAAIRRS